MERIDVHAPVDDLTEEAGARCARCGTGRELDRPNGLLLGGVWYGEIVCTVCLMLPYPHGEPKAPFPRPTPYPPPKR